MEFIEAMLILLGATLLSLIVYAIGIFAIILIVLFVLKLTNIAEKSPSVRAGMKAIQNCLYFA